MSRVFDDDFDIAAWARAGGISRRSLSTWVKADFATTPGQYIEAIRYDTAQSLLLSTPSPVQEIGSAVGIDDPRTFTRGFRRRFGTTPSAWKARYRTEPCATLDDVLARDRVMPWLRAFDTMRAAERDLATYAAESADETGPRQEAEETRARRSSEPIRAKQIQAEHARAQRAWAEHAWRLARPLEAESRRHLVRHVAHDEPALIELLFERSRIEGRGDRAWGIRVAELALDAVPNHVCPAWTIESLNETSIRAWAWLGNARCLALEFPAAAEAFHRARRLTEKIQATAGNATRSELSRLEAGLYWQWSKNERALELASDAVAKAHLASSQDLLSLALRRRAPIWATLEKHDAATSDLRTAIDLLGPNALASQLAPLHLSLASSLACASCFEEGLLYVNEAEKGIGVVSDTRFEAHVLWIKGRCRCGVGHYQHALDSLREANVLLKSLDCGFEHLLCSLDICLAQFDSGRQQEALADADRLLASLAFLEAGPEILSLLRRIERSLLSGTIEYQVLRELRDLAARRLRWNV